MQLGFVSAILPDLDLEEVVSFAAQERFSCVELMCWPRGKAERRYAGVSHIDVDELDARAAERIGALLAEKGVAISGLGYYPNPLSPDGDHRKAASEHLSKVIAGAPRLGLKVVNTFVGRDWRRPLDDNWPQFRELWPGLVGDAERAGVTIGIENCPMLFSADEWPGGKNLAASPAAWRRMFQEVPSAAWGLNFDPSHLVLQHVDAARCVREFGPRIVHVHAKDQRIDREKLYEHGVLGLGWYVPKLPGLGDVDWGRFFAALTETGYDGPVCIEVEDRAYEGSLADRKRSLRQSKRYLEQFVS